MRSSPLPMMTRTSPTHLPLLVSPIQFVLVRVHQDATGSAAASFGARTRQHGGWRYEQDGLNPSGEETHVIGLTTYADMPGSIPTALADPSVNQTFLALSMAMP